MGAGQFTIFLDELDTCASLVGYSGLFGSASQVFWAPREGNPSARGGGTQLYLLKPPTGCM